MEEAVLLRAFQLHCCPLQSWTLYPDSFVTTELTAISPTVEELPLAQAALHGSRLQLVKLRMGSPSGLGKLANMLFFSKSLLFAFPALQTA